MPNMNMDAPVPPFGGLEQIGALPLSSLIPPFLILIPRVDISPAGDEVAFTAVYRESSAAWTTDWKVLTVNLQTGETTFIADLPARATNPAYSPDGRYIAYLSESPILLSLSPPLQPSYLLSFSPSAMNVPGHESDKLHINRYDRNSKQTVTITNQTDISFAGSTPTHSLPSSVS